MKRLVTAVVLVLTAALLAGCVHMNVTLTINSDGSVDYGMDALMSGTLLSMAESQGQHFWDDTATQLQSQGFTVTPLEKGDYKGICATKHFTDIEELNKASMDRTVAPFGGANTSLKVKADKGFFSTTYTILASMDVSARLPSKAGLDETTAQMLDQMKVGMIIKLPVRASSHNATSVSAEGLTYTWEFKLDQPNSVQLIATVPNTGYILLAVGGAALVVIAVAMIFIILLNARKRNAAQAEVAIE